MNKEKIIEGLNDKQQEAVLATEGPCLVIAGAGSGKTKVLTHKIAYEIANGVKPWNILAITFTNKAANEMKERIEKLIGDAAKDLWMGTFHSICVKILRRYIDRIGYKTDFVIFDTSDQKTLIKECIKALKVDDKLFTDRGVPTEISNGKNEMLEPKAYGVKYAGDFRREKIAELYELYQQKLKENNALDFDDIINLTIKILTENPDVLDYYTENIMSAIDRYFAIKTSRTLEIQLKNLILADDIEKCEENIEIFKQQYLHNQLVLEVFKRQEDDIKKLYRYNYDIRKLLYQYYAIREIKRHINRLNERQPLQENIDNVIEHFIEYISSFERGLTYSKKGWVRLMNILYEIYPKAKTQRCIVHIVRNIYGILDKKKSKEIIGDLKKIYTASNGNNAKLEYENFIEKYKSNEKLIKKLNSVIEHIFNIFEYPIEIRKIIYTTNPIESLNSSLRKVTRGKGSFISKEALLKVLYLRIKDLEKSWSKGTRNWENVKHQLIELYGERVLKYYFNT